MYRKLSTVIQVATFVGMIVVAVITWQNESSDELRTEMREGFQAIRADMRDQLKAIRADMRSEHEVIRNDIHDLNGRLGRVEGQLGVFTQERE